MKVTFFCNVEKGSKIYLIELGILINFQKFCKKLILINSIKN